VLTTSKINSLKPRERPYKVADANGLYIDVRPTGTKCWRQKYRFNGIEKLLSHGKYPTVSLAEARQLKENAIRSLHDGIDPAKLKRRSKKDQKNTFEVIAQEWHEKQSINWKPAHAKKVWYQLEADILPYLKDQPINKITPTDLFEVLDRIQKRGALDIASRQRQRCDAIFKHAILTDRARHNPATQLVGVLKTKKVEHRKALDRKELPEFLHRLESAKTHDVILIATKILIYTFVRTSELRGARWVEFDFQDKLWHIPAERMKMASDHLVPLSPQVIALLDQIKPYTGHREYVFASPQRPKQPISENAILNVIYKLGYKGRATGHGFRATASTILNEMGYNPDAIERQLAHVERNKVRAAYHRSEYIEQRIELMTKWSGYLASISNKVIPLGKKESG